jgi:hypothetical protein
MRQLNVNNFPVRTAAWPRCSHLSPLTYRGAMIATFPGLEPRGMEALS